MRCGIYAGRMEQDPLTPDERRTWNEARDRIAHELGTQVAIGRLDRADGAHVIAGIRLDDLWRHYTIRPRSRGQSTH
jgi:hypothetical protein